MKDLMEVKAKLAFGLATAGQGLTLVHLH